MPTDMTTISGTKQLSCTTCGYTIFIDPARWAIYTTGDTESLDYMWPNDCPLCRCGNPMVNSAGNSGGIPGDGA